MEVLLACKKVIEACFDDPALKWDTPPVKVFEESVNLQRNMDLLKFGVRRTDPESTTWHEPLDQLRPIEIMCKLKNAWVRVGSLR